MQPINIYNSQDVNVTIDDNGTPVDVYINSTPVDVYVSGGFATALEFYPTYGDFPAQGQGGILYIAEDTNYIYRWDGAYLQVGGGSLVWGQITGTLSNQTDLQTALDDKVPYTGATQNINIGNNQLIADDGTNDSAFAPSFIGVEDSSGYSFLDPNGVYVADLSGQMEVNALGLVFPDSSIQTTAGITSPQSLQDVTDIGNTTTNDIQLINDADVILGAGGKVIMDNGAKLQEGTTDAGNGGSKGIALKCSADYELKWEAGRLYTMEQNGFTIREVSHNFTFPPTVNDDDAKGFVIDSRWILDNGDIYICSDATTGSAVWSLQASPSGTVTSVDTEGLISGGPITTSGTITTSMATDKLVGRYSSGTGIMEEIIVGDGLTLTGAGRLNNTATPTTLGYYGAWQDNVTQTAAVSNIGYPMIFRTVDLENQVRVVTNGTNLTRITFDNTGIYNLQFSSQFQNTSNQLADVTIWLRLNGTDVAGSSGFISIPNSHGGTPGHSIASWNYLLSVIAGQYYELVWSTTNHTDVTMEFYSAGSPPPSTASVILTVTQQSGIMAGTGITALNSLTGSVQTLVSGTSGSDFGISSSGTIHTFNLPTASATNRGALSSTDWSTFNSKESALTFSSPLSRSVNTISIPVASSSANGYLSSTDWNTFNGKQNALTNPVTGTGTSGQVSYFNGTSTVTGSNNFFWDATNSRLGIGTNQPIFRQHIIGSSDQTHPISLFIENGVQYQATTFGNNALRGVIVEGSTAAYFIGRAVNTSTEFAMGISGATGNPVFIGSMTANDLQLRTNNTSRLNIFNSTGNVAVGTNTDSLAKLTISGTINGSSAIARGVYLNNTLLASANNDVLVALDINTTLSNQGFTGTSSLALRTQTGDVYFASTSGSVGIGTSPTSTSKLTVAGSITASSAIARGVYFNNTLVAAANSDVLVGLDIAPTFTLGAFTGTSSIALRTQTGNIHLASTSGTVGIGTAPTSTYKLDVNGTARVSGVFTTTTTGTFGGTLTLNDGLRINGGYTSFNASTIFGAAGQSGNTFNFSTQYVGAATGATNYFNFTGTLSAQTGGSFVALNMRQTLSNTNSSQTYRGIYYNPIITGLVANTSHIAFENTSGDILLGTTSGSVGIGANTSINASAILHITSTSKGFLPPKMTGAQGEAISSPAEGLMIYTTSAGSGAITSSGWWGYNGTTWVKLN